MATLFITEFMPRQDGLIQAAVTPPVAEQTLAIGGASAVSAPFNPNTGMIRVHTDVICSIAFGFAPTATAASLRLPANISEYFIVKPGTKVAVITNT